MRQDMMHYLILFTLVPFVSRLFHGTSRIWEQKLEFRTKRAYKMYLFQAVTSFGMPRHTDNHSGETIDKIEKAVSGIHNFSGNMFMYLGTFLTLAGSVTALILIWPMTAIVLPIMGAIIFFIIRRFDLRVIDLIKQKNRKEHKVASLMYDYLSNIKTIITLRFAERTWQVLRGKIDEVYPPFKKRAIVNERKWFIVSMVVTIVVSLII